VALASRDDGNPHIQLIPCVHAHPHTVWLDFRITTLGAAIKIDRESLPSLQKLGDLAIVRIVRITVSRDVEAVDAFRASAASIQVILPGNRTPVATEGGGVCDRLPVLAMRWQRQAQAEDFSWSVLLRVARAGQDLVCPRGQ
jgi:hypothetical protein